MRSIYTSRLYDWLCAAVNHIMWITAIRQVFSPIFNISIALIPNAMQMEFNSPKFSLPNFLQLVLIYQTFLPLKFFTIRYASDEFNVSYVISWYEAVFAMPICTIYQRSTTRIQPDQYFMRMYLMYVSCLHIPHIEYLRSMY